MEPVSQRRRAVQDGTELLSSQVQGMKVRQQLYAVPQKFISISSSYHAAASDTLWLLERRPTPITPSRKDEMSPSPSRSHDHPSRHLHTP